MAYLKWGGKKFYPQTPKPYKADINELMKPLSEKAHKGNVWGSQIMNVEKQVIPPPPVVFEAEYQAVLDYATLQGYTLPSYSVQLLQNTLVIDLKTNGNWDEMDVMHVQAGDGDEDFARLNWIVPSAHTATIGGGATYETIDGFKGNGVNAYLNLEYEPAEFRGDTTDISFGFFVKNFTGSTDCPMGCFDGSNGCHWIHFIFGGTPQDAIRLKSDLQFKNPAQTIDGLYNVKRLATTTVNAYVNGGLWFNNAISNTSLPTIKVAALARHRGGDTYDYYSNTNVLFTFQGTRDADKNNLTSTITNYINAL